MGIKKISTEQLVSFYMIKYNKTHATVLNLKKFQLGLSKVLNKNEKKYKVELRLKDLLKLKKGNNFEFENGVICTKSGVELKDIEFSLLLNIDLNLMYECYTILGLYNPKKDNGLQK